MKTITINKSTTRATLAMCTAIAALAVTGQTSALRADLITTGITSSQYNVSFTNINQIVDNTEVDYLSNSSATKTNVGSPTGSWYNNPKNSTRPTANPTIIHGAVGDPAFTSAGTVLGMKFHALDDPNKGYNYALASDGKTIQSQTVHITLSFDLVYPTAQAAPTISAYEFGGYAYEDFGTTVTPLSGSLKVTAKPNGVISQITASSNVAAALNFDPISNDVSDWTAHATTNDAIDTATATTFHVVYDTTLSVSGPYGVNGYINANISKGDLVFTVPAYVPPPNPGDVTAPEPATIGLLGGAGLLLLGRRRNRR